MGQQKAGPCSNTDRLNRESKAGGSPEIDMECKHNNHSPRKFQALAVNRVLNGVTTYRFLSRGYWVPLALQYHCAKPEKGVADTYQIVGTNECISPLDVRELLASGDLIPTTTPQHVSLVAILDAAMAA